MKANNIDSLRRDFYSTKDDSIKLELLTKLCNAFQNTNFDSCISYAQLKLQLAKKNNNLTAIASANDKIADMYARKTQTDLAIKTYFDVISFCEKYDLKLQKGQSLLGLGLAYADLKKYPEAEKYYVESIEILEKETNILALANAYNNLATIYKNTGRLDESITYHKLALDIRQKANDIGGQAHSYNNIGLVYLKKSELDKALDFLFKSLEIKEKRGDVKGSAGSNINISFAYIEKNDFKNALPYVLKGIQLADSAKAYNFLSVGYEKAHKIYAGLGKMDKAYEYSQLYNQLYEKLYNESSNRAITEMEAKYTSEKKQQEIEMLNAQNEINQMQLDKANNLKKIFIAGGFLILIVIFALFFGFNSKRKALKMQQEINQKLEEKNEKILHQSLIIEQKNKDITDSINYAKRIQEALMPSKTEINKHHPNSFMFYLPRDIVSGDFYWYTRIGSYSIFALADCTGHGVPGALMSMIGINLLNQIVKEGDVTSPGVALKMLDNKINQTFNIHRNEDLTSSDGMDIALIAYNEETKVLQYSGANRPLLLTKQHELIEIKPTKHSIGGISAAVKHFKDHEIKLEKDSNIYLFSDGYTDQFGGEKGKKLKYKPFKDFLVSIIDKPMKEQGEIVAKKFFDWKNNLEQIDDICVMGIRV